MLIYMSLNICYYRQCCEKLCCLVVLWKQIIIWWLTNSKITAFFLYRIFVMLKMSLNSLLINLMHPFWIKVFIYFKKNLPDTNFWSLVCLFACLIICNLVLKLLQPCVCFAQCTFQSGVKQIKVPYFVKVKGRWHSVKFLMPVIVLLLCD